MPSAINIYYDPYGDLSISNLDKFSTYYYQDINDVSRNYLSIQTLGMPPSTTTGSGRFGKKPYSLSGLNNILIGKVNYVSIQAYAEASSAGSSNYGQINLFLHRGATQYSRGWQTLTTSYAWYTSTWYTDPSTSNTWYFDNFHNYFTIGFDIRSVMQTVGVNVYVEKLRAIVNVTPIYINGQGPLTKWNGKKIIRWNGEGQGA